MARGITYQIEPWQAIKWEIQPLLVRHWEEVALDRDTIPLVVDYAVYDALAANGSLQIMTVRAAGELVGYFWAVVRTHPHYALTLMAFTDIVYIAPDHRKGMTGVKLFTEMEKHLRGMSVEKIFAGTKEKLNLGPIYKRLSYVVHEVIYSKVLQ